MTRSKYGILTAGPAACGTPPCSQAARGEGLPFGVTRRQSSIFFIVFIASILNTATWAWAEDKSWNAAGDQSSWFDDANWLPASSPTASDDVMINMLDASASIPQAFHAGSITLGGKRQSVLTVNNFVTGTVEPASSSDIAVYNRRDGHWTLKGSAGKITLKGTYKDSEEVIPDEPSFMFYVQ